MGLGKQIGDVTAVVMAIVLAIVFSGIGVYIVTSLGSQANISVLTTLATSLGSWATTWFPIILIVAAAAVIISMLLRGFGGR